MASLPLEGLHETLGLLLEQLPALVEPLAGATLSVVGQLLGRAGGTRRPVLGQEIARLASGLRRQQRRGRRPDDGAQEEPAQIAATSSVIVIILSSSLRSRSTNTLAAPQACGQADD